MTTLLGKSAFPENHPLSIGTGSKTAPKPVDHFMREADLVLGIGSSFSREWMAVPIPAGKKVIQVTNDDRDLNADMVVDLGDPGRRQVGACPTHRRAAPASRCKGQRRCSSNERNCCRQAGLVAGMDAPADFRRGPNQSLSSNLGP